MPDALTLAFAGAELVHVPPDVALVSAVCAPAQTLAAPVIEAGVALTVATMVA